MQPLIVKDSISVRINRGSNFLAIGLEKNVKWLEESQVLFKLLCQYDIHKI